MPNTNTKHKTHIGVYDDTSGDDSFRGPPFTKNQQYRTLSYRPGAYEFCHGNSRKDQPESCILAIVQDNGDRVRLPYLAKLPASQYETMKRMQLRMSPDNNGVLTISFQQDTQLGNYHLTLAMVPHKHTGERLLRFVPTNPRSLAFPPEISGDVITEDESDDLDISNADMRFVLSKVCDSRNGAYVGSKIVTLNKEVVKATENLDQHNIENCTCSEGMNMNVSAALDLGYSDIYNMQLNGQGNDVVLYTLKDTFSKDEEVVCSKIRNSGCVASQCKIKGDVDVDNGDCGCDTEDSEDDDSVMGAAESLAVINNNTKPSGFLIASLALFAVFFIWAFSHWVYHIAYPRVHKWMLERKIDNVGRSLGPATPEGSIQAPPEADEFMKPPGYMPSKVNEFEVGLDPERKF